MMQMAGIDGYISRVVCKPCTKEYEEAWDRIFGEEGNNDASNDGSVSKEC